MSAPPGQVLGQAEAEAGFMHAWLGRRLHHAWLLTGPAGIGKATLAIRLACIVLAGDDPEAAARRVNAGTHADLLVVARAMDEKRQRLRSEIVIDDVRPVSAFLRRTAAEGGWRVVIIDGAEHLNRNAANALLKLLEEPPERALILLVCAAPGRLPPTIRSRCRTLRLTPLDEAAMQQILRHLLPDVTESERRTLITLSGGSPGRALALAAEDGVALSALVDGVLAQHDRPPGLWSYQLADTVLRRDNGFSIFIGLLSGAISTTIRAGLRGDRPGDTCARPAPVAWATLYDELARLRDETESLNLDKRQALLMGLSLLSG